ncbi:hypothetical protein V8F33_012231 [Rhypophila sp. PSN 637]
MAGSDVGGLESVKLLSPEVKAFRARVVAYLLDPTPDKWSHHCCEDLDDVVQCLKLVHFQQSLQYTTKAWHVIEDYGFICEMEVDPLSVTVDMHHLDSWFHMVESMDDESRQLYDKLREEAHHFPKTSASKEYQQHYQRFCEIAGGALTAHIATIKNFFAVHRPDNQLLQRIPVLVSWLVDKTEKQGRWEEAIPENLRDKLTDFTYKWMRWFIFRSMARRARTNSSDDPQEQAYLLPESCPQRFPNS